MSRYHEKRASGTSVRAGRPAYIFARSWNVEPRPVVFWPICRRVASQGENRAAKCRRSGAIQDFIFEPRRYCPHVSEGQRTDHSQRHIDEFVRSRPSSGERPSTKTADDHVSAARRRKFGATLGIVLSLAMAGGLAAAAWTVAISLFPPLQWSQSERDALIVAAYRRGKGDVDTWTSFAEYKDVHDRAHSVVDVAAIGTLQQTFLVRNKGLVTLNSTSVSANLFSVLALRPSIGRFITADDERLGAPTVAVISHNLWQSAFGASKNVVGLTATVATPSQGEHQVEIIGVLPPGTSIVVSGKDVNFIQSLPAEWRSGSLNDRSGGEVTIVGRLQRNSTIVDFDRELDRIYASLDLEYPSRPAGPRTGSAVPLTEFWYGTTRPIRLTMASIVALAAIIALANAIAILLSVAADRRIEFAIRVALGESPLRRWERFATDLLPAGVGVFAVSNLFAIGLLNAAIRLWPNPPGRLLTVSWDSSTLLCSGIFAMSATMLVAAIAAVTSFRSGDVVAVLKDPNTSRRGLQLRRALVATQVLVAAVLATEGLALALSWHGLISQHLGFDIDGVWSARVVATTNYFGRPGDYLRFVSRLRTEVSAVAKSSVAVTVDPPLGVGGDYLRVGFGEGRFRGTQTKAVSDGFFRTLRVPIVAGRDFMMSEPEECPVVVNAALAAHYFGSPGVALQKTVYLGTHVCRIIGVSADLRDGPLAEPPEPAIYPLFSSGLARRDLYLLIRPTLESVTVKEDVTRAIGRVDPQAFVIVERLDARLDSQTALARATAVVTAVLSVIALLLACAGIASTIRQLCVWRLREIAIRLSLGATPISAIALLIRSMVLPTALGTCAALGILVGLGPQAIAPHGKPQYPLGPWLVSMAAIWAVVMVTAYATAREIRSVQPARLLRDS